MKKATYASVKDLLDDALAPGERRLSFAAVLRMRDEGEGSNESAVVLTDTRLLIISVGWPSDYELTEVLDRTECSVVAHEDRPGGTSRLALEYPGGAIRLEFSETWRREAYTIREALSQRAGDPAILTSRSEESLRGALGEVWKDRLLKVPAASPEAAGARILYDAVHGPTQSVGVSWDADAFTELRGLTVGTIQDVEDEG